MPRIPTLKKLVYFAFFVVMTSYAGVLVSQLMKKTT